MTREDAEDVHGNAAILKRQAHALRSQAQKSFHAAKQAGTAPDKDHIRSLTQRAKEIDLRVLTLQDEQHTSVTHAQTEDQPDVQLDDAAAAAAISHIDTGLYLSGYAALSDEAALSTLGVTHILSVCQLFLPTDAQHLAYTCKSVAALDTADQDLLSYIPECVAFIDAALANDGKVLIHCHAGQSRSVAMVAAYLMQRDKLNIHDALEKIRAVRRIDLSENFLNQLRIYRDSDYVVSENSVLYRRWKFETSLGAHDGVHHAAPLTTTKYRDNDTNAKYTQIRCKKCRFVLASQNHIIPHDPKVLTLLPEAQQSSLLPASCAHFFLEPIRWMKGELERGALDGRFTCPNLKCGAKIGSYAWQGTTCSCRRWVLPALCIQRSKVDEMASKTPAKVEPARKPCG